MPPWSLVLIAGLSTAGTTNYALQPAGTFHGDEPVAGDGQAWLALRQHPNGVTELIPTRLRVRTVHDGVLDREDEATGREVSSSVEDALMFLRGDAFKGGRVVAAEITSEALPPSALPDYSIDFAGRPYRIRTDCTPSPDSDSSAEQQEFNCRLLLEHDGRTQPLFAMSGYALAGSTGVLLGDEAGAHLIFAGDLDRDGRLDLIFDGSHHYNVSLPTLFLSSKATPDELVHQVAQYDSVGC
ncbi:hypothetical protein [Lysobacter tyrosinilyticus]